MLSDSNRRVEGVMKMLDICLWRWVKELIPQAMCWWTSPFCCCIYWIHIYYTLSSTDRSLVLSHSLTHEKKETVQLSFLSLPPLLLYVDRQRRRRRRRASKKKERKTFIISTDMKGPFVHLLHHVFLLLIFIIISMWDEFRVTHQQRTSQLSCICASFSDQKNLILIKKRWTCTLYPSLSGFQLKVGYSNVCVCLFFLVCWRADL